MKTCIRLLLAAGGALAGLAAAGAAGAAPIGDALDRPSAVTPLAARAVLLGGAQTGGRLVAVGERGIVALSDDGGAQWRSVAVPASVTLTAVRFTGTHGFAVGHGGTVMTSDDAGSHWTRRLDGRQAARLALLSAQDSGDDAAIRDARQLVADGPDKPFLDVLAFDARHALAVGAYGLAFHTQDGGAHWTPWMARLDNPRGLHLYAIRARGQRIVIAGEQGLVLQSDDAGRHFRRIDTPYKGSFFTLELPADDEIVLAGLRGNVWRSSDAGRQWTQVPVAVPASITGSALQADGSVLMVNQAGMVLTVQGGTLVPLRTTTDTGSPPPLNAVLPRADGSLVTLGMQGVALVPPPGAKP